MQIWIPPSNGYFFPELIWILVKREHHLFCFSSLVTRGRFLHEFRFHPGILWFHPSLKIKTSGIFSNESVVTPANKFERFKFKNIENNKSDKVLNIKSRAPCKLPLVSFYIYIYVLFPFSRTFTPIPVRLSTKKGIKNSRGWIYMRREIGLRWKSDEGSVAAGLRG